MIVLLLAFFAATFWTVVQLPASLPGKGLAFLIGVLVLPVAASPYEWLVHRYVYHGTAIPFLRRIYVIHQHGHHYAIFPTWRYGTNGPVLRHPILSGSRSDLHRTFWSNLRIKAAHFAFYMVLGTVLILAPAWLATRSVAFVAGLLAALLFGTMRRALTEEELAVHGPLAEAEATPVGASEPARLVARPRPRKATIATRVTVANREQRATGR
jgi:hypothetical protein